MKSFYIGISIILPIVWSIPQGTARQYTDEFNPADILDDLDPKANPCEDFYAHTCNNFIRRGFVPPVKTQISSWSQAFNIFRSKIIDLMNGKAGKINPLYKKLYDLCVYSGVEEMETLQLLLLRQGGFPFLKKEISSTLVDVILENAFGTRKQAFFDIHLEDHEFGSFTKLLKISPPFLHELYWIIYDEGVDAKLVDAYKRVQKKIYKKFISSDIPDEILTRTINGVFEFRKKLLTFYIPPWIPSTAVDLPVTHVGNTGSVQWPDDFPEPKSQWQQVIDAYVSDKSSVDLIRIEAIYFFMGLGKLMDETPEHILVHHMQLDTIERYGNYTNNALRKLLDEMGSLVLTNDHNLVEGRLSYDCIRNHNLGILLLEEYQRIHIGVPIERQIIKMKENLLRGYMEQINRTLPNAPGKENWIRSLKKIDLRIGNTIMSNAPSAEYPPDTQLKINIVENNYLMTILNNENELNKYPIDPYSMTASASYDLSLDTLSLSLPIIGFPFLVPNWKNRMSESDEQLKTILNLARLGSIMAHELGHAVHEKLAKEIQKESQKNRDGWWDVFHCSPYITHGEKVGKCIQDQYDNQSVIDTSRKVYLSGMETLIQNLADRLGIEVINELLSNEFGDHYDDPMPKYRNYTRRQLSFIAYGNLWCTSYNQEYIDKLMMRPTAYSTPRLRVNGPLSQMKSFSKAFNCSAGAPMNPRKKCNNLLKTVDEDL